MASNTQVFNTYFNMHYMLSTSLSANTVGKKAHRTFACPCGIYLVDMLNVNGRSLCGNYPEGQAGTLSMEAAGILTQSLSTSASIF